MFNLSAKSQTRLANVHPDLVTTVQQAINLSDIDFGVICGVRTPEQQAALYNSTPRRSHTLKSKHLIQADGYGHAVDLLAYIDGTACWDAYAYDDIAAAIRSATPTGVKIRWGGNWGIQNIAAWQGSMEEAMNGYIDACRRANKRPFVDAYHFEIN